MYSMLSCSRLWNSTRSFFTSYITGCFNPQNTTSVIALHTNLLFAFLKQSVNVVVGDLAVLGCKHVVGAVTNHWQHLVLAEFGVLINKTTYAMDMTHAISTSRLHKLQFFTFNTLKAGTHYQKHGCLKMTPMFTPCVHGWRWSHLWMFDGREHGCLSTQPVFTGRERNTGCSFSALTLLVGSFDP